MPPPFLTQPQFTTVVVASPAAAAETVIASLTLGGVGSPSSSVILDGFAAYTVGAAGTACTLRIRRTGVAGTLVVSSGAMTGQHTAANLVADDIAGVDQPGEVASVTYVLTLQVTAGAGASAVSAVFLRAQPSN